jgi:hypothetical protein
LGLCAGAYYLSSRVEFDAGVLLLADDDPAGSPRPAAPPVVGDRELALFPGVARGAAFPGFDYATERGAVAAPLSFRVPSTTATTPGSSAPASFRWVSASDYCNGGPFFVPYGPEGVGGNGDGSNGSNDENDDPWPFERDPRFEVLARYKEVRHPQARSERAVLGPTEEQRLAAAEAAAGAAAAAATTAASPPPPPPPCPARGPLAAVRVAVGAGCAVLCATHPELAPAWLDPSGGSHEAALGGPRRRGEAAAGSSGGSGSESDGGSSSGTTTSSKSRAAAEAVAAAATEGGVAASAAVAQARPPPGDEALLASAAGDEQALAEHTAALRAELEACQPARELFLSALVHEALRR